MTLTAKQQLFGVEYLKDRNATAAYKRAGYTADGHAAESNASRLLSNAELQQFIQENLSEVKRSLVLEATDVLRELLYLGKSDIRKLFNEDGSLKKPHEWDDATAAAVSGMDVSTTISGDGDELATVTRKVKLWDKKGSLELLGRHMKLFTDVIEIKDTTAISSRMKQARDRAKGKR